MQSQRLSTLFIMKFETVDYFKKINSKSFKTLSDKEIKDLQSTLLVMLKDFDKICAKNSINYSLAGGSVLGAIRHKGFIPWDDDVDLIMTRDNIKKLVNCYNTDLSEKYWLHTPELRPDLGLGFIRLRKKGNILKVREDYYNDECGIFLDIFIIENSFDNVVLKIIHGFLSLLTGFLLSCRNFYRYRILYTQIDSRYYIFKIKILLGFLLSFLPVSFYTKQWNSVNKMCKDDNSKYVTIPCGRNHFFKELYDRKGLTITEKVLFENELLPIPVDYKSYLTKLYGDYMFIPKEKEKHVVLEYIDKI